MLNPQERSVQLGKELLLFNEVAPKLFPLVYDDYKRKNQIVRDLKSFLNKESERQ